MDDKKAKIEQIVKECLVKVANIITQGRTVANWENKYVEKDGKSNKWVILQSG
jgi:hypothetical protein